MASYGTHLEILRAAVAVTTGPVLELGQGLASTPFLERECGDRLLVSADSNPQWFRATVGAPSRRLSLLLTAWDDLYAKIEGMNFDVALVDHAPGPRRKVELARLADRVKLFVVHDTQPAVDRQYRYTEVLPQFLHRYDYRGLTPWTSVVSNDLAAFTAFKAEATARGL